MIVAKLNMKKLPETCKKCPNKRNIKSTEARCVLTGRLCPTEKKESGNVGYAMPDWCPIMDIDLLEED